MAAPSRRSTGRHKGGARVHFRAPSQYARGVTEHVGLYTSAYAGFDAREQVRHATYGDDLGQSGWLTSDELGRFAEWLELGADSRLLDVGCGSGGPALRLAEITGTRVVGIDLLEEGITQRPASHRSGGLTIAPALPESMLPARDSVMTW